MALLVCAAFRCWCAAAAAPVTVPLAVCRVALSFAIACCEDYSYVLRCCESEESVESGQAHSADAENDG
jgi:hypothetical protein